MIYRIASYLLLCTFLNSLLFLQSFEFPSGDRVVVAQDNAQTDRPENLVELLLKVWADNSGNASGKTGTGQWEEGSVERDFLFAGRVRFDPGPPFQPQPAFSQVCPSLPQPMHGTLSPPPKSIS